MKNVEIGGGTIILILLTIIFIAWLFAPIETNISNDLNNDGKVTLVDFSIALSRVESIQNELRNQNVPANVIEDVYPDVPPYSPNK